MQQLPIARFSLVFFLLLLLSNGQVSASSRRQSVGTPFRGHQERQLLDVAAFTRFSALLQALESAQNRSDSLAMIEQLYLRTGSKAFQSFLKQRRITAAALQMSLARYPQYYRRLAAQTLPIDRWNDSLVAMERVLSQHLKAYKSTRIHLVVGMFEVGGAIVKRNVFVCAEMLSDWGSDSSRELPPSLWRMTQKADFLTYAAHETMHTLQRGVPLQEVGALLRHGKFSLLHASMVEGSADYLTQHLLGRNLNGNIVQHLGTEEADWFAAFIQQHQTEPFNYDGWIYQFAPSGGRPPDLGYYFGYRICAAFLARHPQPQQAIQLLLRGGQYRRVYRQSGLG
jgi:hypothetical protein